MMRLKLALGALVVAAILVVGVPMTFRQTLPDVNPPTSSSAPSIGYADITVKVGIAFTSSSFTNGLLNDPSTVKLVATLGTSFATREVCYQPDCKGPPTGPTAPATVFEWPKIATVSTSCLGHATITLTGPLDGVAHGAAEEKSFGVGETVTFSFGHVYFTGQGEVGTVIQVFLRSCYSYNDNAGDQPANQIGNFDRSGWVFDGVNEG